MNDFNKDVTREQTRRDFMTKLLATSSGLVAASLFADVQAQAVEQNLDAQEARNVRLVREAFARQVGDGDRFYTILADDVNWTVALADNPSTYTSRQQFLEEGSGPITDRLSTPIRPTIRELYTAGDTVIAWWDGVATARDGQPYRNSYAWIMTLREDRVVRVVAFLDTAALNELLERVQL